MNRPETEEKVGDIMVQNQEEKHWKAKVRVKKDSFGYLNSKGSADRKIPMRGFLQSERGMRNPAKTRRTTRMRHPSP